MKKLQKLEKRLIGALQEQYGNPSEEAPMPLLEQPSEIVFTALLPAPEPAATQLNYQPSAPPREANLGIGAESGMPQPLGAAAGVNTPPPEGQGGQMPGRPPGLTQAPGMQSGDMPAGGGMQGAMAQMLGARPEPQERPRGRTNMPAAPRPRREEDDLQSLLVRG